MGNQRARDAARTTTKIDRFAPDFAARNDRYGTPLSILDAVTVDLGLPRFDLDPCGAPDHDTAVEVWTPESIGDGLSMPWHGRVWMNPPYGPTMPTWVERFILHDGGGIALIPVSPGIRLWQDLILDYATAIHYWRHRIRFIREEAPDQMVSPTESALIAFTPLDADALVAARLPGHTTRYLDVPPDLGPERSAERLRAHAAEVYAADRALGKFV